MDGGAVSPPVVLVHGLWMHGIAMAWLAARLRRRGFRTLAPSYPTVRRGLDDNADRLAETLAGFRQGGTAHLVGHSMGGLLILRMLERHPDLPVGRIVLLGSPVRGSSLAHILARNGVLRRIIGRSLADWQRAPRLQAPPNRSIAVIAGNSGLGTARCFRDVPRPNDGVVAVCETCFDDLPPPLVLPVNHSQMLVSRSVADRVAGFLAGGRL